MVGGKKYFLLIRICGFVLIQNVALCAVCWPQAGGAAAPEQEGGVTPDGPPQRVDVRVRRVILKYESVVSFLMPEGEFNASFEKRFGHFSSLTRARYNFVRGEMGFAFQNIYAKFRLVPEFFVYDKLSFVPVFSHSKVWRREQGVQLGGRFLISSRLNSSTSLNYLRFTFPSTINLQKIASQRFTVITQSLGTDVDSLRFLGLRHTGTFEIRLHRAFAFAGSEHNFWQLEVQAAGRSNGPHIRLGGELVWVSLLNGVTAPPRFLGGRNRLSAYETNAFSGVNLAYAGLKLLLPVRRLKFPLPFQAAFREIALGLHGEAGQVGDDRALRNVQHYKTSLGVGLHAVTEIKKARAFEFFFYIYAAPASGNQTKYYFGISL